MAIDPKKRIELSTLKPGSRIADRCEILKRLGSSSCGVVYACRDWAEGGRVVAIKILFRMGGCDEGETFSRFLNEIMACYELNHPNVIKAYDHFGAEGFMAFTMEYVEGENLGDKVSREGPLPCIEAAQYLAQLTSGLSAIHASKLVHRDIKPENIVISPWKNLKIVDFGIVHKKSMRRITTDGSLLGALNYLSPEYIEHGIVDERSDIYAAGLCGYEMATGRSPFEGIEGMSIADSLCTRLNTRVAAPRTIRSNCSANLEEIIMRAVETNPAMRYQTALEMQRDLSELLGAGEKLVNTTVRSAISVKKSLLPVELAMEKFSKFNSDYNN